MSVKLCPHVQDLGKCRWLGTKVVTPGDYIKVMDPGHGIQARFPGKRIVGRWFIENESEYIQRGAVGADAYYDRLAAKYEECAADLAVIEAINEPVVHSLADLQVLGDFLMRWVQQMHRHGYIVGVPAFSVGNPEPWVIPALATVWEATDYWTLHEYGTRRMDEEWRAFTSLRHRTIAQEMATAGIEVKPLLITETGIDRGGRGYRAKPGNTPIKDYIEQLAWYNDRLNEDPYVEAAFIFCSGSTKTWQSFEFGEAEWRDLAKRLK